MTVYQQYLGQVALTSSMNSFTVGGNAVELTLANYYLNGYTGESRAQLCEHMQAQIRALGGSYTGATVTRSASTGLVTINLGTTATIVWSDAALGTLMGFTGSQAGASSYTATNAARYCWAPSLSASEYPGDLASMWLEGSTSVMSIAPSGKLVSTEGALLYSANLLYENLDRDEVISDSATVWETFQRFWLDVVHKGMPVRAYPDKSLNTSTSYVTGRIVPTGDDLMSGEPIVIGDLTRYVERVQPGYNGLWKVFFRMAKEV